MPYMRPGVMKYATATKNIWHGFPCVEGGASGDAWVGVAVKQKAPSAVAGGGTPQKQIVVGENFAIISKGVVTVPALSGAVAGDALYIVVATNALTKTSSSNIKFGRVVELAGTRGVPAGKMRVDLDAKDSF